MDTPETLAAGMLKAAAEMVAVASAVVGKGALNIKNQAKQNVRASAPTHNAGAHNAITYDNPTVEIWFGSPTIGSEIGYDKAKRGGSLGNLLEYGGGGDHSPPHRDLGRALDVEEPKFEAFLAAAVEKLL